MICLFLGHGYGVYSKWWSCPVSNILDQYFVLGYSNCSNIIKSKWYETNLLYMMVSGVGGGGSHEEISSDIGSGVNGEKLGTGYK